MSEHANKEEDFSCNLQFSKEADRVQRRILLLQDDQRDQQAVLSLTLPFIIGVHANVENDKAALQSSLLRA